MSTTPTMTLYGMSMYTDGAIWEDLNLPEDIDAGGFVARLMMTRGQLGVLWPDPDYMQLMIGIWSNNWYDSFNRINQTLTAEYNPIHNFDRHEEYTDTEDTDRDIAKTGASVGSGTSESQVSAFNESTYQPDSKITNSSGDESNEHVIDGTDRSLQHYGHLYGNIGVTKSQEMVTDEVELRKNIRLYDLMGDVFAQELLILTY